VTDPSLIIQRFAQTARPLMRRFMPAASCIASVKTTIEVMRHFQLRVIECPVSFAFTVPGKSFARVAGFSRAERKRMEEKALTWRDERPAEGGWNGHLIALVENRWILDPSIDQAHAPEFGVEIPPEILVIDVNGHQWKPRGFEMRLGLRLDNGEEASVRYRSIKNRSYLDTEAWNDEGLPLLAAQIAKGMMPQ
jgi:hypothetical protein